MTTIPATAANSRRSVTTETAEPPATRTSTRRSRNVSLWVLQGLLAAVYVMSALPKLTADPQVVAGFAAIGFGPVGLFVIAVLEIAGAVALLIPRLCGLAALAFVGLMLGAVVATALGVGVGMAALPATLLVLVAVVAWARRGRTRRPAAPAAPRLGATFEHRRGSRVAVTCGAVSLCSAQPVTATGAARPSPSEGDYEGGDVVHAACLVRGLDECSAGVLGLGVFVEDRREPVVVDHAGQTVAAQQQPVGRTRCDPADVGSGVGLHTDVAGEPSAFRVGGGFRRGDLTGVEQCLRQRVVPGQHAQMALTPQVGPAVADVGDQHVRATDQRDRDGGTHTHEPGPARRAVSKLGAELSQCGAQRLTGRRCGKVGLRAEVLCDESRQRGHDDLGGQCAGGSAAHAVGDDEQAELGVGSPAILVTGAHPTAIGETRVAQLGHRLTPRRATRLPDRPRWSR